MIKIYPARGISTHYSHMRLHTHEHSHTHARTFITTHQYRCPLSSPPSSSSSSSLLWFFLCSATSTPPIKNSSRKFHSSLHSIVLQLCRMECKEVWSDRAYATWTHQHYFCHWSHQHLRRENWENLKKNTFKNNQNEILFIHRFLLWISRMGCVQNTNGNFSQNIRK